MDFASGFEFLKHARLENQDIESNIEEYVPQTVMHFTFMTQLAAMHTAYKTVDQQTVDDGCDAHQHVQRLNTKVFGEQPVMSSMATLECQCVIGFLQTVFFGKFCKRHADRFKGDPALGASTGLMEGWVKADYGHMVHDRLEAHYNVYKQLDTVAKARETYEQSLNLDALFGDEEIRGL